MTVNTTKITSGPYVGNGIASTFSYTFKIDDKTQLSVYETNDLGVQTTLVVDTDYTVANIGNDGGGIITRVAGVLPTNYEWFIRSNYQETQLTAFSSQGAFFPDLHENAMDKMTFLIQQILDTGSRSVRIGETEIPIISTELALPGVRGGKILGFAADGSLEYVSAAIAAGDFTNVTTTAVMAALTGVVVGTSVAQTKEFSTGIGGGGTYDAVTVGTTANVDLPNTHNIIVSTADATICWVLRLYSPMSMRVFGGTDAALQAMDGLVKRVWLDIDFTVNTPLVFNNPIALSMIAGFTITPALGLTGGNCISSPTDDFIMEHTKWNGAGQTFSPATGNTRIILAGDSDFVSGSHDGSDDATVLSDSTKSWTINEYIGYTAINMTDGSRGIITANTATTATAVLEHGEENAWDATDEYRIKKRYRNHKYNRNTILNASFTDGNLGNGPPKNLKVTHAFYIDGVDDVEANFNKVDAISGACFFLKDVTNIHGVGNHFEAFRWYAVQMDHSVSNFSFNHGTFLSTTPEGCYWGGAVNTVSDFDLPSSTMVKDGTFNYNHFEGNYSYGAVARFQSSSNIEFAHNTGKNFSVGTADSAGDFTGIRAITRGISTTDKQDPCRDLKIHHNEFEGPSGVTGKRHFIYVDNNYWLQVTSGTQTITVDAAAGTFTRSAGSFLTDGFEEGKKFAPTGYVNAGNEKERTASDVSALVITTTELTGLVNEAGDADEVITQDNPSTGIEVYSNKGFSPSSTKYWEDGVIFHGQNGGVRHIRNEDNYCEVRSASGPAVNGAIGYTSTSAAGAVKHIKEGGNHIVEMGTGTSSYHLGIGYDAYTDNVIQTKPNTIDGFWYGVRTLTNCGANLDKIDDNEYLNIVTANELFAVKPSRYGRYLTGSKTYDPPSIAAGAQTTTDVTVTGAVLTGFARASFSLDQGNLHINAYVRTANSVRVTFVNNTGGAIDLASGTLNVRVDQ